MRQKNVQKDLINYDNFRFIVRYLEKKSIIDMIRWLAEDTETKIYTKGMIYE